MHLWIDFWSFVFWISLVSFVFNYNNFLFYFFYSEFVWLVLYCLTTSLSVFVDDLVLSGLTFFFLALAGVEFAIGFVLLTSFKHFKISMVIVENSKVSGLFYKNIKSSLFIDNFYWNK